MLATLAEHPFSDPGWLFEIKWDGVRALARIEDAELALSSRNGVDVTKLSDEYGQIINEITRQATVGGLAGTTSFSVFVSSETTVSDGVITDSSIGGATSFTTAAQAQTALTQVTAAIDTLGDVQNEVGILENKLAFAISLAQSQVVNTKAAESRIRDANIAEESANLTRFNILSQSGIAALAQANQSSSYVLSLLR